MLGFGIFTRRELYTFTQGENTYRYTSGDKFVTVDTFVYEPLAISRNGIKSSGDLEKNSVDITFPLDSQFAQNNLRSALEQNVLVTISKYQSGSASILWQGRLTKVKPDGATIKLTFESDYTSLGRAGARYKFQRTCCHDLYGPGCKLDKNAWKVKTTIQSVDKVNVVLRGLTTYADSYFRLGMLESAKHVFVGVEASSANNITLIRRLDSLIDQVTTDATLTTLANKLTTLNTAIATFQQAQTDYNAALATLNAMQPTDPNYANQQAIVAAKLQALNTAQAAKDAAQLDYDTFNASINYVYVYPGCMKSLNACNTFGNTDNFMGFPYIPEDNPTTTRIV